MFAPFVVEMKRPDEHVIDSQADALFRAVFADWAVTVKRYHQPAYITDASIHNLDPLHRGIRLRQGRVGEGPGGRETLCWPTEPLLETYLTASAAVANTDRSV